MAYTTPFGTITNEAAAHIDRGGGLGTTVGRAAIVHETFSQFMSMEAMNGTDADDLANALLTAVARVLVQFSSNIALNNLGSMSDKNVQEVLDQAIDIVCILSDAAAVELSGKVKSGGVHVVYLLKGGKQ